MNYLKEHKLKDCLKYNRESEVAEAIKAINAHDTYGVWFKDGFAIVSRKHWEMCDSTEYSRDKIKLIEENRELKRKIYKIQKVLGD